MRITDLIHKNLSIWATLMALVFCLFTRIGDAQQLPPSVPDIDVERWRSGKDYAEAAHEWQLREATFPMSSADYLNWFKAIYFGEKYFSDFKREQNKLLSQEQVLKKMGEKFASTYEYAYASYLFKGKTSDGFDDLKTAMNLYPSAIEILDDAVLMNYAMNDMQAAQRSAILLANARNVSDSRLDYSFNVLSSVELNGVLITQGCSDSYPLIMIQLLNGYRSDVQIIPLDYLELDAFKGRISNTLGVQVSTKNPTMSICSNSNRSVYLACSIHTATLKKFSTKLYCTGLAFKYSETELLNIPTMLYAWNQLFKKENINTSEPHNRNYLPMLVQLANYYKATGDTGNSTLFQQRALEIANTFGIRKTIQNQLH